MPSYVMHHHFAKLVQDAAPRAVAQVCEAAPDAYFWGSQGPDPFFFAVCNGDTAKLGGKMHRGSIGEAFNAIAAQASGSAAGTAYLFGFCTHYALDRTAHPYIEDQTRRLMAHYGIGSSAAHKLCETDLDASVLLERGEDPATYPAYRILDSETPSRAVIGSLLAAAGNAAGGEVSAQDASRALRAMYEVYRLLHERRALGGALRIGERLARQPGVLSAMIRRSELLPDDSLNRARRAWLDWEGRTHTEDFRSLMEADALAFALKLQRAACAAARRGCAFPPELFDRDYSGRQLDRRAV